MKSRQPRLLLNWRHVRATNLQSRPSLHHKPIFEHTRSSKYSTTSRNMSSSGVLATARSLDHLVLTVKDIPATIAFYTRYLNMTHNQFTPPSAPGNPRHALSFGVQKINLHQSGAEFEPKALDVKPGSADLCFLIEDDVDEVLGRIQAEGELKVLEGSKVVERTGAQGKLRSLYVRDPDGNLIELSNLVEKS